MKRFFVLAFVSLAVTLVAQEEAVFGSPLDCETIRDADQRNYCRAITKKEASWCEFIKAHDLRQRCRAEVR